MSERAEHYAERLNELFDKINADEDGWEDQIVAVERILKEDPELADEVSRLSD